MRKIKLLPFVLLCLTKFTSHAQSENQYYKFKPASYIHGPEGLQKFLSENINLKRRDFTTSITGNLNIKFCVTKDGTCKDFVMLDTTSSANFNNEVLKYIKLNGSYWNAAEISKQKIDVNVLTSITPMTSEGINIYYFLLASYLNLTDALLINAYYNIGSEMTSQGNYEEAINHLDIVLNLSPADIDALYNRGVCYLKKGDKVRSCDDWKKIQLLGKTDADKLIIKYCNN